MIGKNESRDCAGVQSLLLYWCEDFLLSKQERPAVGEKKGGVRRIP